MPLKLYVTYLGDLTSQVDIYESRPFIGGKVGSFVDKGGNHIEMGLHVFFGCYNNLFRLMKKVKKRLLCCGVVCFNFTPHMGIRRLRVGGCCNAGFYSSIFYPKKF